MEMGDIHIQVSVNADEVACRENDFEVLAEVTTYCIGWKNSVLEEETLEDQIASILTTYRNHNQLDPTHELEVGVWFTTPIPDPTVEWQQWDEIENFVKAIGDQFSKPKLTVIKGGKDDNKND